MSFFAEINAFRGSFYFVKGNAEKANKYYQKAIDKGTKNGIAYLNYSISLLRAGTWEEALVLLEKGAACQNKLLVDKNIFVSIATCYWISGDIDKAIETFQQIYEKYEFYDLNSLITLGYMYTLKEDYENALEYTNKAIEQSPDSGAAWDNLGQIRFRQGEYDGAKEAFEKAVILKPNLPDSLYYLGLIAEQQDDAESAADYFDQASKCDITFFNTVTLEKINNKKCQKG